MKRLLFSFAFYGLLVGSGALNGRLAAQTPPPAPGVVVQFLSFSDAQVSRFQQLLQGLQGAVSGVEQQVAVKQQQLQSLLAADRPDAAAVGALLVGIVALQRQMAPAVKAYQDQFVAMLTQEQKEKVGFLAQAVQVLPAVHAFAELRLIAPPQ